MIVCMFVQRVMYACSDTFHNPQVARVHTLMEPGSSQRVCIRNAHETQPQITVGAAIIVVGAPIIVVGAP